MKIGVIGCGYVSDSYMETLRYHPELEVVGVADKDPERAHILASHYGLSVKSVDELIDDPEIQIIVNITDPESHYEINKRALLAGKHTYSEKPLAVNLDKAKELFRLAEQNGLILSSAPCSVLSETAQTLWQAVEQGAIGVPKLVYAELDDNPIYMMKPESWTNARGIPWPYLGEYKVGCTLEHAGYYLTWLCAMFGPAATVTAFSDVVVPEKSEPAFTTPDIAFALIKFESGVVARLSCTIVAPYDHRIKIIGDEGVLECEECWNYAAPVYLEKFTQASLNARKSRSVRRNGLLRAFFGMGGRRQRLVAKPFSQAPGIWADFRARKTGTVRSLVRLLSKREMVCMDFFRGVADMARTIETHEPLVLDGAFVLHVNELTLAMQNAGLADNSYKMTTRFDPRNSTAIMQLSIDNYNKPQSGFLAGITNSLIERLHRH